MRNPDIVNMRFGSHLYGLNTPNSDVDYKGIYLPNLDELLLGNYAKTFKSSTGGDDVKNKPGDIDTEIIALPRFIELAVAGETMALDMLHCNDPLSTSDIWQDLVSKRKLFYSRNLKAFVGYVKRQAAKYGIKGSRLADIKRALEVAESYKESGSGITVAHIKHYLPLGDFLSWKTSTSEAGEQTFYEVNGKKYQSTLSITQLYENLQKMYDSYGERAKLAERNDGVDWKAVSHALRAGYQARDIYLLGDFEYPLKETEFLKRVKTGQLDYKEEVAPALEELVAEVEELAESSDLPEKVNRKYWDNWLLQVYREKFNI